MISRVGDNCYGCAACHDICPYQAISFKQDNTGFFYPQINISLCIQCNLCEKICPALNSLKTNETRYTYAVKTKNYQASPYSSSGGAFFIIANTILRQNGVIYGAAYDQNMQLIHMRVESQDALRKLCGSKYIQSNLSGIFLSIKNDIKLGKEILFVGTPCQTSALRLFLRKDYSNIYIIDLLCHGVPSSGIFAEYIKYIEKLRKKKVSNFIIRDNREGWNRIFKSTIKYSDNTEEYNSMLSNLWNHVFFSEKIIRKSCANCKFANSKRIGDITLGDFWGIDKILPKAYDQRGVSLLKINTQKGEHLFAKIQGDIIAFEAETSETEHPNLFHPTTQSPERDKVLFDFSRFGFSYMIKKHFGYSKVLDLKIKLKSLIKLVSKK